MKKDEFIDLKNTIIDPNILSELPLTMIEKNNIIPYKKEKTHYLLQLTVQKIMNYNQ